MLVAYDGKRMTRNCISLLAANPTLTNLPVHVVMSGKQNGEVDKHLAWASSTLTKSAFNVPPEVTLGLARRLTAAAQHIQRNVLLLLIERFQ